MWGLRTELAAALGLTLLGLALALFFAVKHIGVQQAELSQVKQENTDLRAQAAVTSDALAERDRALQDAAQEYDTTLRKLHHANAQIKAFLDQPVPAAVVDSVLSRPGAPGSSAAAAGPDTGTDVGSPDGMAVRDLAEGIAVFRRALRSCNGDKAAVEEILRGGG